MSLSLAACKSDTGNPYYEFNPSTNSNEYPYFVEFTPESVTVDADAGVAQVVALYKPFDPVSTCTDMQTAELHYEIDLFSMRSLREGAETLQPASATPISEEEYRDRYHYLWSNPDSHIPHPEFFGPDDTAYSISLPGGHSRQQFAPPYAVRCGIVQLWKNENIGDSSSISHTLVGKTMLLCGYGGGPRCGDSLCHLTVPPPGLPCRAGLGTRWVPFVRFRVGF